MDGLVMAEKICPRCEGEEFEESFTHFDGFCTHCGLVIEDFNNPRSITPSQQPDKHNEESLIDQDVPDWPEYVTITNATEQQYAQAIDELETFADELWVPANSRVKIAEFYADAMLERSTDGRATPAVIGALLHIVSRNAEEIRPICAISDCIDMEEQRITSFVRNLQYELSHEVAVSKPIGFLPYLCNTLDFDEDVSHRSEQVIDKLEECGLSNGKSPGGIAGAVLYEVTNGSRTQREIAEAVGVSTETIRQRLNDIRGNEEVQFNGGC